VNDKYDGWGYVNEYNLFSDNNLDLFSLDNSTLNIHRAFLIQILFLFLLPDQEPFHNLNLIRLKYQTSQPHKINNTEE
jgi:hypothetical protein